MALSKLAPGIRFHPTDDELVMYYLKRKLSGKNIRGNAIAEVNIYDFGPWDLPSKSSLGSRDLEWYFFCPRAKKYSSGPRSNRATETGFWKATGKDKKVEYNGKTVGIRKTLVFHKGHAGNGERTDWVMHEYRMEEEHFANAGINQGIEDMYVVCKIFEKSGAGPKNGAQYGAPYNEEEWEDDAAIIASCSTNPLNRPATTTITGPASSTITCSANITMISPTDYKQKGPATSDITVPQRTRSISVNEAGSSMITFAENVNTDPVDYKQKGPATFTANDDVVRLEDFDFIVEEPTEDLNANDKNKEGDEVGNEDYAIFADLVNLIPLEDLNDAELGSDTFKNDGAAEYTRERLTAPDDLDATLKRFYVD